MRLMSFLASASVQPIFFNAVRERVTVRVCVCVREGEREREGEGEGEGVCGVCFQDTNSQTDNRR